MRKRKAFEYAIFLCCLQACGLLLKSTQLPVINAGVTSVPEPLSGAVRPIRTVGKRENSSYSNGRNNQTSSNLKRKTDTAQYPSQLNFIVKSARTNQSCHFDRSRNILVNGRTLPLWQNRLRQCGSLGHVINGKRHFNITEALQVRIYTDDQARWTVRELKQWIHYLFLAGVEHIYLCDHYKYDHEKLDVPLRRYLDLGLVTYIPWSEIRSPMSAQVRCYKHITRMTKNCSTWQLAVDMDEYPWAPQDNDDGFLARYLQNITSELSEISMSNYLMLGQGDRSRTLVVDRINRMTPKPANRLVKPIYRPDRVSANIHRNKLLGGSRRHAHASKLRMLHYWGARLQSWGPDTERIFNITREMNAMRESWADKLRNSLLVFGEEDAFSSTTGP